MAAAGAHGTHWRPAQAGGIEARDLRLPCLRSHKIKASETIFMPPGEFENLLQPGRSESSKQRTRSSEPRPESTTSTRISSSLKRRSAALRGWGARRGRPRIILGGAVVGHPQGSIIPADVPHRRRQIHSRIQKSHRRCAQARRLLLMSVAPRRGMARRLRHVHREQVQPVSSSALTREELAACPMNSACRFSELIAEINN